MSELPPQVQQQLEEQKKNCPFCKILKGEIPAEKVYQDSKLFAILDINPVVKGHVLLLPKDHAPILPLLPKESMKHLFSVLPMFTQFVQKAMVATGANILISNGGAAGQQSPHFLVHVLARDKQDGIYNYLFNKKKELNAAQEKEAFGMLSHNLPLMIQKNVPGAIPGTASSSNVLYEDEKVTVVSENPQAIGHVVVHPKEKKEFTALNGEDAFYYMSVASLCATAVFEGLKCHGTNILVKTGYSADNEGGFSIHVIPRFENDGLDIVIPPMSKKPDVKSIASKLKDKLVILEHEVKEGKLGGSKDAKKEVAFSFGSDDKKEVLREKIVKTLTKPNTPAGAKEEIMHAIEELMKR